MFVLKVIIPLFRTFQCTFFRKHNKYYWGINKSFVEEVMSAFFVCWAGLITFVKPNRIYKVILGDDVSISCGQAGLVPGIITSQEQNNFAESACWTYSNNYCNTGMIIQDNQLRSIEYTDSNGNIVGSKIINSEYRNWKTGYDDSPPNCNGICNVVIDYMGYWEILLNDELNDERLLCHEGKLNNWFIVI